MTVRTRVGLWGVFGRGNFGNEATLAAFIDRLPRDAFELTVLGENPATIEREHGVSALRVGAPVGSLGSNRVVRVVQILVNRLDYLIRSLRIVARLDAVVVAGCGGLERYGAGAFGTPFEIWAQGLACRLLRRPFLLVNVGIEYLPRPMARYFVRRAAALATYRSYRDEASRACMVRSGYPGAAGDQVATDMAFGLHPTLSATRSTDEVLIGVMSYGGRDGGIERGGPRDSYARRVVTLVRAFARESISVRLVGGDDEDVEFARTLVTETGLGAEGVLSARTAEDLTRSMSAVGAVVATRYHTMIMALLASTPVVSIGYAPKHRSMLNQLGLDSPHHDVESFEPEAIVEAVKRSIAEGPPLRQQIADAVTAARTLLDEQWPAVLRAITGSRTQVSV